MLNKFKPVLSLAAVVTFAGASPSAAQNTEYTYAQCLADCVTYYSDWYWACNASCDERFGIRNNVTDNNELDPNLLRPD